MGKGGKEGMGLKGRGEGVRAVASPRWVAACVRALESVLPGGVPPVCACAGASPKGGPPTHALPPARTAHAGASWRS